MSKESNKIRYIVYLRKSSESEDKQVQSIDDQNNWLKKRAIDLNLNVVKTYKEERSAKKPNNRPVFEEMLNYIEQGKADGIITWQLNRLSRNPIDSARVQWLLQEGVLRSIITNEKEYLPNDNAILFSVESGMANQFIIELRANTMRGIESKINKGWFPGMAPIGYLNDKTNEKGHKQILVDTERWDYVRRIWDLMLTGNYNPNQILRIISAEGLTTRKTKHQGGGAVTQSGIYRILTNNFYTGVFEICNKVYDGKHKPMVSNEEFERVQQILGAKGRPRPQKREFSYTGLVRCGECDCLITAETKTKFIKSTAQIASYTYYRCTKKKRNSICSQRPIKIEELERQVLHALSGLTIAPEFKEWALKFLEQESKQEFKFRADKHKALTKIIKDKELELYDLNKTYTRGKLDDDFYEAERQALKLSIAQHSTELANSRDATDKWITLSENVFKFACHAAETFVKADVRTRREIFNSLGGYFKLTDGVLSYQPEEWFTKITNEYPELEKKLKVARTRQSSNLYLEFVEIARIMKTWGELWGSNPRPSEPQPDALTN